jgi:hypothetical protein
MGVFREPIAKPGFSFSKMLLREEPIMTRKFPINLKKLNKIMYVIASVFLLSSLLLSAVNLPAFAYNNPTVFEDGVVEDEGQEGESAAGEGSDENTGEESGENPSDENDEESNRSSGESSGNDSGTSSDDGSNEEPGDNSGGDTGEESDSSSDQTAGNENGEGSEDGAGEDQGNDIEQDVQADQAQPQPTPTPEPALTLTPEVELAQSQRQGNITGSSLTAVGGCSGSCQSVSATFKNVGDGDMQQASSWELYYSASGFNNASKVDGVGGSFGPLAAGEQQTITTAAVNGSGQYWIIVKQEAGHPGTGEVKSDGCTVVCTDPTPTPPPPEVFNVSFLQGSSQGLCKVETGTATATVKVDLSEGVSGSLVTTWQVVSPSGSNPGGPGATHSQTVAVGDGDEVAVNAAWPGIPLGATEPIEVAFTAVLMVEGVQKATASFSYHWDAEVCPPPPVTGTVDLSLVCGFPGSDYTFRVQNNMNVTKAYQLAVQGEAELITGTLAPGESEIHSVARGGDKQATLYIDGSPVASVTADEENSVCLDNLALSYVCTDGGILYSVTNPNNFTIEFSALLDGNPAGTGSVDANTTTSFLFSNSGQHTVSVIWSHDIFTNNSSGIITNPITCVDPGEFLPLLLSYACSGEGLEWTVTNPNSFAVEFDWRVLEEQVVSVGKIGSGLAAPVAVPSGTETVDANGSLMFYFSGQDAVDVEVRYLADQEEVIIVESSEEDVCKEPPSEPPTEPPPNNPPTDNPLPPAPPQPPQVFVPQPEIAAVPEVLIPVTGVDLANLNGLGLVRELAFNIGAVVLGLALVLEALRKGLGK